jgi:ribosome-binding factor A
MGYNKYGDGRSSSRYAAGDRSKRQERVGHVVRSEIATILHNGSMIKYDDEPIEDELRKKINVINADVSPDLRQARITVSIMAGKDDIVSKRRAYAWLVRCTKSIRHALAQKMKHMKASPDITFVQVDVGAAVDVMQLIEKVSKGYKRDDQSFELEYDDDDEDEWVDEFEDGEERVIDDDDDDWIDLDSTEGDVSVEMDMGEEKV